MLTADGSWIARRNNINGLQPSFLIRNTPRSGTIYRPWCGKDTSQKHPRASGDSRRVKMSNEIDLCFPASCLKALLLMWSRPAALVNVKSSAKAGYPLGPSLLSSPMPRTHFLRATLLVLFILPSHCAALPVPAAHGPTSAQASRCEQIPA